MTDILINNAFGKDNIEKAAVAFIVAGASADRDGETAMFLTSEAIHLATEHGNDLSTPGFPPVRDLVQAYIDKGGILWVCKACADAKGLTGDHLMLGAEIAGAGHILGFIDNGGQVLM